MENLLHQALTKAMGKKGSAQVWNRLNALNSFRESSGTAVEITANGKAVLSSHFQNLIHMAKQVLHLGLFSHKIGKEIHSNDSLSANQFLQMFFLYISRSVPHFSYI